MAELPVPGHPVAPQRRTLPRGDAAGSRDRDYLVCAPPCQAAARPFRRPALVMVLHGCRQEATDILHASRFAETAGIDEAVLVFPSITSWASFPPRTSNCWGFWIPAERRRDAGEAGDLRRLIAAVEAEFDTDPARRYIAGLSSGGAMAVVMAAVYGDAIRAAGSVAGLAFGETGAAVTPAAPVPSLCPWFLNAEALQRSPRLRSRDGLVREMSEARHRTGHADPVPLMVLHSVRDRVVRVENAHMLRDVWLAAHDGDPESVRALARGWPIDHRRYADTAGRTLLETVFYQGRAEDPTHYWPGDHERPPFAHPDGPSATRMLVNFFRGNGL